MGSKGGAPTTTNTNQSQTYNPAGAGYVQSALDKAGAAASQPFNIPQAPVAGFSQDQTNAFNTVNNAQGMAQPYINQAQQYFTPQGAQSFLNPYASNVMAGMQNVFGQQQSQTTGQLTQAAGGVGADRIGVGQANLANQQDLAAGQTLSGLYGNAVQQAQSAGYGTAALGSQAQNAALTGAQAQLATGGLQQQLQQAQLNAPYQQQLAQSAFPYQQAQFLAGITGSLAPGLGGTTSGSGNSTTTPPAPSMWSQLLGAGTAAAGIYGQTGGFGGKGAGNPAYGGNGVYGGSSTNPLPGLSASDYGTGYAEGGEVSDAPIDISKQSVIPTVQMQPMQTQMPQLNLNPPPQQQQQSGGGAGDAISTGLKVAQMAMMFANRGGRTPYDTGGVVDTDDQIAPDMGFAEGGDTDAVDLGEPFRMPDKAAVDAWRADADGALPFSGEATPAATPVTARRGAGAPIVLPPSPAAQKMSPYSAPADEDPEDPNPPTDFAKSPWAALTAAGLGMMSGTSPYAGVNIGQGGLQGVKTLESMRAASQKDETISQATKRLAQEAKFHEDQYNRETVGQKLQREQADRPYTEMTAAQKATDERAAKTHEDQYTRPTPYQQFEMSKPVPMGTRYDAASGQTLTTYGVRQPDGSFKPVGPAADAQLNNTDPNAVLPPNARPMQGLLPGKDIPQGVNPEVLANVPEDLANNVRAIDEGRSKLTDIPLKQRFMVGKLVHAYDPNFDETIWGLRNKQQAEMSTNGNAGKMILAVNQLLPHLKTASDKADELENSDYPAANTVGNWWATATGDPRVKKFNTVREVAAMDAARLLRGSGAMAEEDIKFWRDNLAASGSPRQLQDTLGLLADDLMGARISSIQHSYRTNMRMEPPDFVSKEAKDALGAIRQRQSGATKPPAAGGAPAPATPPPAHAAPQVGEKRTNAHGVTGVWNGTGWEVVQ